MTQFMPHGMCYLWQPSLLWLHAISDGLIALSYFAIPVALVYLVHRKRADLPFHWLFGFFAAFIVACGATHVMNVWTLWNPDYWLSGGVKVVTAIASLGTAILLVPVLPKVLALKSPYELERMNAELEDANRRLEREVAERKRAEEELRHREQQLADAQRIARMGSWEWEIGEDRVEWSDEMCRIYGVERAGDGLDYDEFLDRVHPEDRERADRAVRDAFDSGEPFEFEHRIVRPDGSIRTLHARGRVQRDEAGRAVRMVGTGQDITERKAAEAARRESELRYRAIFDQSYGILGIMDPDGTVIDANETSLEGAGLAREQAVGEPFWEAGWWDLTGGARERTKAAVEAAREGQLVREQVPYRTAGGERRLVDRSLKPVVDDEGKVKYIVAEGRDVTEVEEAKRSLEVLARVGELLGATLDPRATLREIASHLVESFADVCFFDIVAEDGREIERLAAASTDPGVPEVDPDELRRHVPSRNAEAHPVVAAIERGESTHVQSVDEGWRASVALDEKHLDYLRELGFTTLVTVPVEARGRVLGAMTLTRVRDEAPPLKETDRELAEELGRRVGVALDNARLYEALQRSEEDYRLLAERSTDAILRFSPEGEITYASPAIRRMLGYVPEDVMGRSGAEFIHPDDLPDVVEAHRELLKESATRSVMCRLRHADGEWVWAETASQDVRNPETGRVGAIVAVARDVTENVEAARTIRLIQRAAIAANEAGSLQGAVRSVLELVCEHAGWPLAHAYVPARAGDGARGPTDIWYAGEEEGSERIRELTASLGLAASSGPVGRVLETGEPEWVTDLEAEESFRSAGLGERTDVRASFVFPVEVGETTMAALEFLSPDARPPEPRLQEAMETIGTQLGQAVLRQRVEAALQESEARFRALAESASDAIVTVDEENRIVYCNESATRIFGYSVEELVGGPVTRLVPERFREAHREGIERFLDTRDPEIMGEPVELVGLHKSGGEIPIELSLGWWESEEGLFFTGVVRDITDRKRTETALNEKMEELARSNSELALFTYVASHDLREPLRTVGSNVQLVARRLGSEVEADVRKSLDFALGGVRRMRNLIDDLLVYSRVGTEGKPFVPVDAGMALSEAVESLHATIEEEGARITQDALPTVQADRSQLVQVFQNLLSNAIKFQGEEPPEIHVSAERDGEEWTIAVRDNGIGIDPAYAEHVFTIFQRLHSEEEVPGTGIGLAVCRKVVERHGGRIWVESAKGEGATFKFTLPTAG
ncbi:MAG: PAS domain S-box protein [Gemmatimonadota bacterium]|nr:PAS domain S-box protein [Gemmatimonadota bacterium]